jgi:hypothetical protein
MRYWVESEDLWCANEQGVIWHGRPDGYPVYLAAALPGTDDAIAVLNWEAGPRNPLGNVKSWPNLIRVRPDGTVVWRTLASIGSGEPDFWVSLHITDRGVFANTWSCYRRQLDQDSGRVLASMFTK